MTASGRKLAKRACDGCKIRKIKCSEVAPCDGCVAAGIACTFIKQPLIRGPRRLRKSTLREISQSQQQWEDLGFGSGIPNEPVDHTKLDAESVFAPNKVAALVLQLCVYRLRMYPVWPIIKVERLVASLQKPEPDIEVFGLAYAIAAATIAQIRTKPSAQPGAVTAEMMEAQCQYAKARRHKNQPPDLTTVRTPFFLHVYYENLEPGGLRSITYLREAIAVAHMIGLHRETYYTDVQLEEREIRRRTLWLLFVAERNISISYKLPVIVRTKTAFPGTIDSDSEHVLVAYQKLVTMFWDFDRSGVFEFLDRCNFDFVVATTRRPPPSIMSALTVMRKRLDEIPINVESMEDTQAFDILITRQWMRIILWRLCQTGSNTTQNLEQVQLVIREALQIVRDLMAEIVHTPEVTIEAHSAMFETKIFEIATSIVDVVGALDITLGVDEVFAEEIKAILIQLKSFLRRNDNIERKLLTHIDEVKKKADIHPIVRLVLTATMKNQYLGPHAGSVDSVTLFGASESPASNAGVGSQASVSPRSHLSAQNGYLGSALDTTNAPASSSPHVPLQNTLDQPYLDMDWSQYGESPEMNFSTGTWHDINFVFDGT